MWIHFTMLVAPNEEEWTGLIELPVDRYWLIDWLIMVVWLSCRDSPCARCSLWLTRTTSKQYGVFIMVHLLTHYVYLMLLIDWLIDWLIAVLHLIGNVSAIYQRMTAPLWRLLKRSNYWIVLILKFCLNCYLVKAI